MNHLHYSPVSLERFGGALLLSSGVFYRLSIQAWLRVLSWIRDIAISGKYPLLKKNWSQVSLSLGFHCILIYLCFTDLTPAAAVLVQVCQELYNLLDWIITVSDGSFNL